MMAGREIARVLRAGLPGKEIRFLTPGSPDTLLQAAQNSALVFLVAGGFHTTQFSGRRLCNSPTKLGNRQPN